MSALEHVSRALGLAQALANPVVTPVREGATEEIATGIVTLLTAARRELLAGSESPALSRGGTDGS